MNRNTEAILLLIADIQFKITAEKGIFLTLAQRHSAFRVTEKEIGNINTDLVRIKFCHNLPDPDTSPVKIWEVPGDSPSWKVFDYHNESRIFLYNNSKAEATIISIKPNKLNYDILIKAPHSNNVEVMKYPMDIIILYYISLNFPLLIVHASGFLLRSCGHVCVGKSGVGKSTLFDLAAKAGGLMVQDDRLILRQTKEGWFMYPMPLNGNDNPVRVKICRINALLHGPRNLAIPLSGAARLNQFLPHIVHFPNWNHLYRFQLTLVSDLLRRIRLFQFLFIPELSAIHYLQNGKDTGKSNYISPEKPVSSKIKSFRQKHDPFYLSR